MREAPSSTGSSFTPGRRACRRPWRKHGAQAQASGTRGRDAHPAHSFLHGAAGPRAQARAPSAASTLIGCRGPGRVRREDSAAETGPEGWPISPPLGVSCSGRARGRRD